MSIFSAGLAGDAVVDGDGVVVGMRIPGFDMSIFSGDAEVAAAAVCCDMPGIFMSTL